MADDTHVDLFPHETFALGGSTPSKTFTLRLAQIGFFRVHVTGLATVDDDPGTIGSRSIGVPLRPGGGNGPGPGPGPGPGAGSGGGHAPPPPPPRRGPVNLGWTLVSPDGVSHKALPGADPRVLITAELLARNRDAAGFSSKLWSLTVSLPDHVLALEEATCAAQVDAVVEPNLSAPPLVKTVTTIDAKGKVEFDVTPQSVGDFVIDLSGIEPKIEITLSNPTGAPFASATGSMQQAIAAADLLRFGRIGWKLSLANPGIKPTEVTVLARIVATLRIPTTVLQPRLDAVLQGSIEGASFQVTIDNEMVPPPIALKSVNVVSITIDEDLFFSLDAFGFLDNLQAAALSAARAKDPQAPAFDVDPGVSYPVARLDASGARITGLRIAGLSVVFGPPDNLPNGPFLTVTIPLSAPPGRKTEINVGAAQTVEIKGGTITAEMFVSAGELSGAGVAWVVDVSKVGWNLENLPDQLGREDVETQLKDTITTALNAAFSARSLTTMLTTLMGAELTLLSGAWDRGAFVFKYVPAIEPAVHQVSPHYSARGTIPAGTPVSFKSPNMDKIDHVVVLLMENRSFDHVLGHLSLIEGRTDIDGLTQAYIDSYAQGARPAPVPETRLPFDPDHSFAGTAMQMGGDLGGHGPMRGFMLSFLGKYPFVALPAGSPQRDAQDDPFWRPFRNRYGMSAILGYHTAQTLPTFAALAREYMVCDRWFSSHPGPTFPNRFYYLGGQLGRDAAGEPQRDNGADSLRLLRSRTIQDALTEHGVPWIMYESRPDVCMLRMYARYAFDDTLIRPIDEFYEVAHAGKLPSVTFLEPQYHLGKNTSDDHPPSDMALGQEFIARVYAALTSNASAWEKTLFIISYDEHGGLADHVFPPLADRYQAPAEPVLETHYGVRVPAFIISPWVPAGSTTAVAGAQVYDHTSILKTIANKFMPVESALLSDRMAYANDLFPLLALKAPRPATQIVPAGSIPAPAAAQSRIALINDGKELHAPLRRGRDLFGPNVDWHEYMARLALLVT